MRNFWVAIIGVLTITLFAGTSFATAPMVQDIPDFKLLTGSGTIDDFDLNDYVTDYDDPVSSLNWTIEGTPYNASLSGTGSRLLDIAGSSTNGQGVNAYRVSDATQSDAQSVDSSVVKYSSILVSGPGLTQDNNLVPPDAFARTWVVEASRTLTTPAISTLITPPGGTPELSVSIADLDGNLLDGTNTTTATSGDLQAVINGSGELELSAPAGLYPLAGPLQLSGAYRVGIKAKLTGGALAVDEANWDGAELLVSTSRLPTNIDQSDLAKLDRFNNFEVDTAGALPISPAAMRALSEGEKARWYATKTGSATVAIAASAPTGATSAWASSGKAVKATLTAAGEKVVIKSENFSDIQPGEKLTLQANVTTSTAVGSKPVDIWMFMGPLTVASNYQGLALQAGSGAVTSNIQVPVGGDSGWRTLKTTFVADTFGAAVQGATETVNFYAGGQQAGQQAHITVVGGTGVTYPVDVYIDKVRIYRNNSELDNALAATAIPVVYKNWTTEVFDGTIESATDLSKLETTRKSGTTAIAELNDNVGDNSPLHQGSKSLAMYIPDAKTATTGAELALIRVQLDATPAGGKDYRGDGIYGFSFWFKTDAPDVASTPGIFAYLTDNFYKNLPFADVGYVGCPLAGQGWKKVEVSSARFGANVLLGAINVRSSNHGLTTRPWWGQFKNAAEKPSAEEDAKVFIDDLKFHKVQDEVTYFDRSVFPVAD